MYDDIRTAQLGEQTPYNVVLDTNECRHKEQVYGWENAVKLARQLNYTAITERHFKLWAAVTIEVYRSHGYTTLAYIMNDGSVIPTNKDGNGIQ